MKQIFLIIVGLTTALLANFTKSGDVVTDNTTHLQWQDNEIVELTWWGAIDYCEALNLGGYSDWRLPNIKELQSIVDYSRFDPAIDPIFTYTGTYRYWSSTLDADPEAGGYAWFVYFYNGEMDHYPRFGVTENFRCVR